MSHVRPDAIDVAAGLSQTDARFRLRSRRPEFIDGAEACRSAVLAPVNEHGLSSALRHALAHRVAAANGCDALTAQYAQALSELSPGADETAIAEGRDPVELPQPLRAITRHADIITLNPRKASAHDIARLQSVNLSAPQIIALSQLLAFVSFQTRIAIGLSLMEKD